MSSPSPVRLAFIGLKGINAWHYLPGLKDLPDFELVAGVDPSPQARASFAEKSPVPTYAGLPELLAQHKIDAVFIGSPNQFHLPNIREAVAAGLHVAVTKPLANTVEDCQVAVKLCREAGLVLQVNQEYRYRPVVATGIALALSGDIGEISMVIAHMGADGGIAAGNAGTWRADPANVPGGCLNLNGVHMFDCANAILGRPTQVTSRIRCLQSTYGIIDTGGAFIDYEGGGLGSITVSYASGHQDSIVICGTKGNLVITEKTLHRLVKRVPTPIEPQSTASSAQILLRQFSKAILQGAPLEMPGEAGLLLVAMTAAAIKSSDHNRTVSIAEILSGPAN